MSIYKNIDFISARNRAFAHLSRLYNTHRNSVPADAVLDTEAWPVELEILVHGQTRSLTVVVCLEPDFPLSLPVIFLSKEDVGKLGFLPNIDTQGLICAFDTSTNIPNPEAPEKLIETCVLQAKNIIETGLNNDNINKYDQEFIAYWENTYNAEGSVDTSVLSLIPDRGALPSAIGYVEIAPSIGKFHAFIYSEMRQFAEFQRYLKSHQISWRETPTFYLGNLDIWPPPYHLSNHAAIDLVKSVNLENEFIAYLRSKPSQPIVTFSRVINERILVFGWWHKPVTQRVRYLKGKTTQKQVKLSRNEYPKLFNQENASILVNRLSPQVYSRERLVQRTASDSDQYENKEIKSVLVAGLGSIGSNLIPFLEKTGINEYRLVDEDSLFLDNLGRHFLGINHVGKNKAKAIRDYLEEKNPLLTVHTREVRIIPLIHKDLQFLSSCDCYFFCTGDVNSEMWLAQNICGSEWNHPAFFIWVEPYLAGGHCVYYNGIDQIAWDDLFPNSRFIYNIISEETHNQIVFNKREAGCQVTYIPYSASNLQLFLAAIFPKILNSMKTKENNKSFSWTGDLAILEKLGIKLSPYGVSAESFCLIERSI